MKNRLLLFALILAGCATSHRSAQNTGPWDLKKLAQTPNVEWGAKSGLSQEVYYQGEPYHGKPTRVFAYLSRPKGHGPFPALVLVHGVGGKAFRSWAEHWAKRGYVALAMDTAGCGTNGPMADGGPGQGDDVKFREFTRADIPDMWTYHAVADVIRGISLLASLPEVDERKIGITGISWGGYLTCIVAGLDHRLKVAVPVYGCGFLGRDSWWKTNSLAKMSPVALELWLEQFDPSMYLAGVRCPILFLNGSNDFAYPLDSYQASYQLVDPRLRNVSIVIDLKHGHIWNMDEVDYFVDAALRDGQQLPKLGPMQINGSTTDAAFSSPAPVTNAFLHYTTDQGEWQKRAWTTAPAEVGSNSISAQLPVQRPLVYYLSVVDQRGLRVSTEHEELQ